MIPRTSRCNAGGNAVAADPEPLKDGTPLMVCAFWRWRIIERSERLPVAPDEVEDLTHELAGAALSMPDLERTAGDHGQTGQMP